MVARLGKSSMPTSRADIYDAIVLASDSTFATTQNLSVTVTEVSEAVA